MVALARIQQAQCRLGRFHTLKIADFSISAGEHWCVFGANGAGKSVLAELLSGKRRDSHHYVEYAGQFDPGLDVFVVSFEEQQRLWQRDNRLDISEYSADGQDLGTQVSELITAARPRSEQEPDLLAALITSLDLQALLSKGIRYLSSGQLRRAMIARGLYGVLFKPERMLILDEPMESIDRHSRQRIRDCIDQYRSHGFASLELCRRVADIPAGITHLALLQELQLLEQGEPDHIRSSKVFKALADPQPQIPRQLPALPVAEPASDSDDAAPLIELRNVQASYGQTKVLSDVCWRMTTSDHVVIDGPNGCGKSTLLSLIDGENHMAYGQDVFLFGKRKGSGETIWEVKARFGIVSNDLHNKYIKGWRVLAVVVSGFFDTVGLYDDSGSREQMQAQQWLTALGLADYASRYYDELSYGQQRLVLLARAMVKQPAILILDEPCVGLDDFHRRMVLGVLDRIAAQLPTQLIYVSHVAGEQPTCINSRITFRELDGGGHTIEQTHC